jgi:histidinol-phosphate/aromatic aminotransferase/cobyric acid decarboxylase-like protein
LDLFAERRQFLLRQASVALRHDAAADAGRGLRAHGIKLCDCASFGLEGHVRISVQAPDAQQALHDAWRQLVGTG